MSTYTVTNLTKSPYMLRLAGGGTERIASLQTLEEVELDPDLVGAYRQTKYFEIEATEDDGGEGPSRADLAEQYAALAEKDAPKSWNKAKLQEAIDEILAS